MGKIFISYEKVWLTDNTLIINAKKENFYFVYFLLKKAKLENMNVGSTQPLITQSSLKNIDLLLPIKNILRKFEEQTRNFFTKINYNQTQIQTLENLRNSLLPKLISGKIRVNF